MPTTYGATKPELHDTMFAMAKTVAGKFVVISDGTGPSPPLQNPIQKLAMMKRMITVVLSQPTFGTVARHIAEPNEATAEKHFLHFVRFMYPAWIHFSDKNPALTDDTIDAVYKAALSKPFYGI